MSSLSQYTRDAVKAERLRQRIRRIGFTSMGYPLWSENEDTWCRSLYPNYAALVQALPRRSRGAIVKRCGALNITIHIHRWTPLELSRLRKLYQSAPWETLDQAFPFSTRSKIRAIANSYGFRRPRRPYKPTGHDIIDCIRERAFDLNVTMRDLDWMCRSKYFSKAKWRYHEWGR